MYIITHLSAYTIELTYLHKKRPQVKSPDYPLLQAQFLVCFDHKKVVLLK